ncbi:MAG: histidinol-phosphatase [Candidatus Hydrogenedentes bacterium]|nr:histidinol-phosphatase [Candidatus Hydrogenedentota bacterium]
MKRILSAALVASALVFSAQSAADAQWYKGATHVHSLWSDGDGAPEIIADWYKSQGWDFLCFSDHNILLEGEKYVPVVADGKLTPERLLAIQQRFGREWIDLRQTGTNREMRLKTLAELAAHFEEPGKFILIQAEEMTTAGGNPHMNAINLREVVPGAPEEGDAAPKMNAYLDAIEAQQAKHGAPMFVHLNHPNWRNALSTETLLAVPRLRFFEVYNGAGPTDRGYPERGVPSTERHWDVVQSMQLRRNPDYILYGVATDDSHNYHKFEPGAANPGRGWVMVRAEALEVSAIVEAMRRGDFYGSSGVTLKAIDRGAGGLGVEIDAQPGVTYTTRYIGTRKGFAEAATPFLGADGQPVAGSSLIYSDAIGAVLHETTETRSRYAFQGDELYVRATITSDKVMENPPVAGDVEMAWVQPVLVK